MSKQSPSLDDEIQALYRGPLAEFTATRQALAKRLRQAGDPRHAEVGAMRKPSLSAWAVNRLFGIEPEAMTGLVGAGERARAAQKKPAKSADAAALRELVATIRREIGRLTERGVEILAEAERAPGEAIVERLRTNLRSLALDPATAAAAERDWLDQDLEPPSFELLAALTVAAAEPREKESATPLRSGAIEAPQREHTSATVHQIDEARKATAERKEHEEQERRERIERAETELARAEVAAAAEQQAAERAEADAQRAETEAAEAERLAEELRSKARTAQRAAQEVKERAADAEATARRAREALERAQRP